MKKKITLITLLFTFIFSSSVFAKSFDSIDSVDTQKIWTVSFNKPIESVELSVLDKEGYPVGIILDISNNKAILTPLLGYAPGTYTLKVKEAKAKDGTYLKESADLKFTVERK